MNTNSIVARAKAILTTPKTEWPVIAGEQATVGGLYSSYIIPLALIPTVAYFVKNSIIGYSFLGVTSRTGIVPGVIHAAIYFAVLLVAVYVFAIIVNELAPRFGGQKNQVQALKAVAYSFTAGMVASIAVIIPAIGGLIALAGVIYGLYLLRLGLPVLMTAPDEKAVAYTGISAVIYVVLGIIVSVVLGPLLGVSAANMASLGGPGGSTVTVDKNSPLGGLEQWSKSIEQANKKYEEAQKSGDTEAQQKAMGEMMGSIFGGGEQVESLAPERLKAFVPDTLVGLARTDYSAERNQAMGMQISAANASYSDGNKSLHLEITDMGSAKGLAGLASWAAVQQDRESSTGYERTRKDGNRMVHEQWDSQTHDGEYTVILANRFSVKVSGQAGSMDDLKRAANSVDLGGLEGLKDEGVKKGG